jgi:glycosyltransferase involved in cell wall biosynthesis
MASASEVAPEAKPLAGKKIVYAITKSNGGGATSYVVMLARAAQEQAADVCVLAGKPATTSGNEGSARVPFLFSELAGSGVRTVQLTQIQRDLGLGSEWRAWSELRHMLSIERPDVLHLNSSKMGFLGALAGRSVGVKRIVFTAHGWPHKEPRSLLWKLMAWLGSWLTVVLCDEVFCVSEDDLREAPTLFFRDTLRLIHNGIADVPLKSREESRQALAALAPDIAYFPHLLMMNAELHPNKGVGTAIRALAQLRERDPDLALVVCGEGEERNQLTELARALGVSSRVFLLGFVPHARELLRAADIYLMPSRKEGLPLALLEAGLAELPVIASKVGGIPEVITDHESGLFMPRGNTQILAQAIAFLLNNPDTAYAYGAQLRETVRANFSEAAMITQTFERY